MGTIRILQVIPNLKAGGAERMVVDIATALSHHPDVDCKVLLLEDNVDYEPPFEYEVSSSRFKPSITGKTVKELEDYNDLLHSFDPHIIHSHLFQAEMFVRSSLWPGTIYFCHFHNKMDQFKRLAWDTFRSKINVTRFYERNLLMRSYKQLPAHFIAISKDVAQYIDHHVPSWAGKVHLLPNAVDLNRFYPSKDATSSNQYSLVTVGRLDKNKNHAFLLEMMAHLRIEIPNIQLRIVGEGPLKDDLKRKVENLGLQSSVTLTGYQIRPEETLRQASVYVHSARQEGFGLTLVEAMASGLPVVALDGGGNRDIIDNGINGYLMDEADPKLFAQKVRELIDIPANYQNMQKGALQTAQKFGMEEYVDKLLTIYEEAIAEAGAPQTAES